MSQSIRAKKIGELMEKYPFLEDFFLQNRLFTQNAQDLTLEQYLNSLSEEEIEEKALDIRKIPEEMEDYIRQVEEFLGIREDQSVSSLTILPGYTKDRVPESFEKLRLVPSQITSIVGPTGSGKSRLLADIEWTAQGDTPTGRTILINDKKPDLKWRFSSNNRLVAQLSQNMNFVMDLGVREFLEMHAQSRMAAQPEETIRRIMDAANELAGEKFSENTPVTGLSGGQSRALMIADTAILSASPIVLIDEIENAGIDREKALKLLVSEDKIVLIATHDPFLALMADQRIVIQNGGISRILPTSSEEKVLLEKLSDMDRTIQKLRSDLRSGKALQGTDISLGIPL